MLHLAGLVMLSGAFTLESAVAFDRFGKDGGFGIEKVVVVLVTMLQLVAGVVIWMLLYYCD